MDFGDLVFFLIFIIIIVTNIIGQVKKSRRPQGGSGDAEEGRFDSETRPEPGETPTSSKTGWRQVLDDILVEVREQAQTRSRPDADSEDPAFRQPSGWDVLMGETEKKRDQPTPPLTGRGTAGKSATRDRKVSSVPAPRAKRAAPYSSLNRKRPERTSYTPAYWSEEHRQTEAKGHYRGPARRRIPLQDLKNAIIWHEILSPPVALRDTDVGNYR
jgi:hypothetical protein